MSTATARRIEVRVIAGRRIEKHTLPGAIVWREVHRREPIEVQHFDQETGTTTTGLQYFDPRIVWEDAINPTAARARFAHVRLRDFDPREPSPLHEQLERARQAGFVELVEAFSLAAKVKARLPLAGFDLGDVKLSYNVGNRRIARDQEVRGYLRQHANQELPEPTDDQLWCPMLFDEPIQNVAALASVFGAVKSRFMSEGDPPAPYSGAVCAVDNRRKSEQIEIWTIIEHGQAQIVCFAPRFDLG
jgi:hypothetical protein